MQILVVVANIQVRSLKAEVEKGFTRTAVDRESIGPKAEINLAKVGTFDSCFYLLFREFLEMWVISGSA